MINLINEPLLNGYSKYKAFVQFRQELHRLAGIIPFVLIFIFLVPGNSASAQNLVPNPSFEQYALCPDQIASNYFDDYVTDWYRPNWATTDYFNACAPVSSFYNVPTNGAGFEYAYDGGGMVGMVCYVDIDENSAEYVQCRLLEPMIGCRTYYVSFYVSLTEKSFLAFHQIGAYFSSNPIHRNDYLRFTETPQVSNPAGNFITDTIGWTKISGYYTASGQEQYLTIGSFGAPPFDTLPVPSNGWPEFWGQRHSYYFLDSVTVIPVDNNFCLPNVFSPNGDGVNDVVTLPTMTNTSPIFSIYNRWGNLVKGISGTQPLQWDGSDESGQPCSEGVYYYTLQFIAPDNSLREQKGFIQLVR